MLTRQEIFNRKGEEVVLDIETYPNYFLICVEYIKGGKVWFEGCDFNRKMLLWILQNCTVYTFNGNKFDIPIALYSVYVPTYTEIDLYNLAQDLIGNTIRPWEVGHGYINWSYTGVNHIDLIELCIGQASLKTYAGRIHAPYMQDLPYPHWSTLTDDQKAQVLSYCWNDTNNTMLLKKTLQEQIDLRVSMSHKYAVDLRSKSDAQIAEAVISNELRGKHHIYAKKPKLDTTYAFSYNVPSNVKFESDYLNSMLATVRKAVFTLDFTGKIVMPKELDGLLITIGKTTYQMGMGGLHSTEGWMVHKASNSHMIVDRDVTSYYPMIIIKQGLYPKHLTPAFLSVYRDIVDTRVAAKARGDSVTANTLKIVVNGSFGKFGSAYSILFSPDLLIQTTVSGQLYLLMLIERLTNAGFHVFSGNTDGIVTMLEREKKDEFDRIVSEWEKDTGFATEEVEYLQYCARDVNNYLAVKPGGKVKTKGFFGDDGLSKNPSGKIISKAVGEYFANGRDVADTINSSTDIGDFLFVRKVEGGCLDQDKQPVGKVIRWYMAKGEFYPLTYASNGNKVPQSDGARVYMDLTQPFPSDLNREHYIRKANEVISEMTKDRTRQLEFFL
jgi:DNA polymerase elongation subunit (family B)